MANFRYAGRIRTPAQTWDSNWRTRGQLPTQGWRSKFTRKYRKMLIVLAPRDGFEPPTNGLTVRRSTTELPGNAEEAADCREARPLSQEIARRQKSRAGSAKAKRDRRRHAVRRVPRVAHSRIRLT